MMHFKMFLEDSLDQSDVSWITRISTLTTPIRKSLSSKMIKRSKHNKILDSLAYAKDVFDHKNASY